jgi:hypothetical protein
MLRISEQTGRWMDGWDVYRRFLWCRGNCVRTHGPRFAKGSRGELKFRATTNFRIRLPRAVPEVCAPIGCHRWHVVGLKHIIADLRESLRLPDLVSVLGQFGGPAFTGHRRAEISSEGCLTDMGWIFTCGSQEAVCHRQRFSRAENGARCLLQVGALTWVRLPCVISVTANRRQSRLGCPPFPSSLTPPKSSSSHQGDCECLDTFAR